MRSKTLCLCLGVVVALCLALPAAATEDAPAVPDTQDTQDSCIDSTPVEPKGAEAALSFLQTDAEAVAPGCKACKDRPTCTCTMNNFTGMLICRD